MTELRVLSFRVNKSHPDFAVAYGQCSEVRRLRNTLVAVSREANSYRMWPDDARHRANTSIADSLGKVSTKFVRSSPRLTTKHVFAQVFKEVVKAQGIDLNSKVCQRVGIGVSQSWKSFFANKSCHGHAPGFTKTLAVAEFTSQAISTKKLRCNQVVPSGWKHGVKLPEHVSGERVQAVRLVPLSAKDIRLEVMYSVEVPTVSPPGDLIVGIDLGVNNFAAVAFSDHRTGVIVPGGPLKSVNSYYNKLIASRRGVIDSHRDNLSKKINGELTRKDKNYVNLFRTPSCVVDTWWSRQQRKIDHYLHTASSQLTAELVSAGVGVAVIGWSSGFKSRLALGKKNNQSFALIPHRRFVTELTRKLTEAGITVIEQEESYTSQASFLDGDAIPVYERSKQGTYSFSGKRVTRGLYRTASGAFINADLNGAYNIMCKAVEGIMPPFGDHDKGTVVVPARRLKLPGFIPSRTVSV